MGKKTDKTEIEAESEPNYSDPEDFIDDVPEEGFYFAFRVEFFSK